MTNLYSVNFESASAFSHHKPYQQTPRTPLANLSFHALSENMAPEPQSPGPRRKYFSESFRVHCHSVHDLQQFRLQYKFPLLILLARLISFVIFPSHGFIALSAYDVANDVSSCGHVSLHSFSGFYVDDTREEEGFAVLATEVLLLQGGVSWVYEEGKTCLDGCIEEL